MLSARSRSIPKRVIRYTREPRARKALNARARALAGPESRAATISLSLTGALQPRQPGSCDPTARGLVWPRAERGLRIGAVSALLHDAHPHEPARHRWQEQAGPQRVRAGGDRVATNASNCRSSEYTGHLPLRLTLIACHFTLLADRKRHHVTR